MEISNTFDWEKQFTGKCFELNFKKKNISLEVA